MDPKEGAQLLSRAEAAALLAVSTDTLRRLIRDGELGVVRIGRSVLIPQDEVIALVERRRAERRPMRPTCSSCHRRIVGARLVIDGRWMCSACVYERERHGGLPMSSGGAAVRTDEELG